jgi:phage shock protein A
MSIFSRIFKVGQAHASRAVDKLEKPEVMLDQAIEDKQKQIREAKQSIQSCIATERETKKQLETERNEQTAWEQKAEAALKAGKEDLAAKALQRAGDHEQKAASLETHWRQQRDSVEELKKEVFKMEDELNEFRRNKEFIVAQSKAADVKKNIYEAKAKIGKNGKGADDLMERMQRKAERSGNEADAAREMAESFDGRDSLEKEFESLETPATNPGVQSKLEAMKARLAADKGG